MQKSIWIGLILLVSSPALALEGPGTAATIAEPASGEGGEAESAEKAEATEEAQPETAGEPAEASAPAAAADTPAEPVVEAASEPESQAAPAPPVVVVEPKEVLAPAAPDPLPAPVKAAKKEFEIGFGGYLRVHGSSLSADRFLGASLGADEGNNPWMGRNDGFSLGDARLNMRATYGDNLYVRLGFDGAVAAYEDSLSPVGSLSTGLKDAYFRYSFGGSTQLFVGRFKPPFDIEELISTKDQQFVHSAIESRGVSPSEGNYVGGMAPGRQMGVMIADPVLFGLGAMDLGYAVALTNGNSGDATHNDNDLPAIFGRMTLAWGTTAGGNDEEGPATQASYQNGGTMGLGGYVNQKTSGVPPTRFSDMVIGLGLDLNLSYSGTFFRGQVLWENENHKDYPSAGSVQALGGHGEAGYRFDGMRLEVGYRYGFYDPRFSVEQDAEVPTSIDYDLVMHHTIGVRWQAEDMPLVVWGEYTSSQEANGATLSNERVEAAVQVTF